MPVVNVVLDGRILHIPSHCNKVELDTRLFYKNVCYDPLPYKTCHPKTVCIGRWWSGLGCCCCCIVV